MNPKTKTKASNFFITKEEAEKQDNEVPFGLPKDAGLPTRKQFRESEQEWVQLARQVKNSPTETE